MMISMLSYQIMSTLAGVSVISGFFWEDRYSASYLGSLRKRFFCSKRRSFLSAHIPMLLGLIIMILIETNTNLYDIVWFYILCEIVFLAMAPTLFMNWKIGRWSFAPRHRYWVEMITRKEDIEKLDREFLRAHLESMLWESKKGNTSSQQLLSSLVNRNDDLGLVVKDELQILGIKSFD